MAKEKEETGNGGGSGGSMTKLVIIIVVLQLVMFGGFGAFLYFSGALGGGGAGHEAVATEEGHHDAKEEESHEEAPPIYIPLEPAFVVNFSDSSGGSRFMQATIQVMTRDPEIEAAVNTHMPVIRNAIVLLLSSQSVEGVAGIEGKEKLRAEVLEKIREILKERTGKPGVEDIYFTSFVIQ